MKTEGYLTLCCFEDMKSFLVILFSFLLFTSTAQFEKGKVIDTVVCAKNAQQTYSLYLPSNYHSEKAWPVIYFFEPAARGSLPVKKYAPVAEELGYILVCSNNSRNGSFNLGFDAAEAIFQDTQRFSIDFKRRYLSGFSGGSRLALSIAVLNKQFAGVIGVGATQPPIPGYQLRSKQKLVYVGLVGARDMNYREHKGFAGYLDQVGVKNILVPSNKKHQWPSSEDFRIGLLWIESQNDESKSTDFLSSIETKLEIEQDSLPLSDLIYLDKYVSKLQLDENSKEVKKALKLEARYFKKEDELRNMLQDSIDAAFAISNPKSKVVSWITREARRINNYRSKSKDVGEQMMNDRLLAHVGGFPFESAQFYLNDGLYDKALVGFTIWKTISKSNVYADWMLAKTYSLKGEPKKALDHLGKMIKAGFSKKSLLLSDPQLANVRELPDFDSLMESIPVN